MSKWEQISAEQAEALIRDKALRCDVNRTFEPPLVTFNDPAKSWPESVVLKLVSEKPPVYVRRKGA